MSKTDPGPLETSKTKMELPVTIINGYPIYAKSHDVRLTWPWPLNSGFSRGVSL